MHDPAALRDEAQEFRSIARDITDKPLRQALVKLALTYDAIAHRIDIGRVIARA